MQYLLESLIFLTSLFLILLILIQRGRGGGLAGALGGMGGQSAFGTKAGDLFTRITVGVAAFWILLSVVAIALLNQSHSVFGGGGTGSAFSGDASKDTPGTTTEPAGGAAGSATIFPKSDDEPMGDSGATPKAESGTGSDPAASAPATTTPPATTPPASTPASSAPAGDRAPAPATPEKE